MKAKEFALKLGLTEEEFDRIQNGLGREPNETELGMFSVMWSEHCSYKNTRKELRKFPTTGPAVLVKAGEENAGVVDAGDGLALAFKIESHNHPSAVEPFQGAATGVGGILRDIFTMGARPVAFMDSLRFGRPDAPGEAGKRTRSLIHGVVAGISHYGNCVGVPTVGGELVFDPAYEGNPLVNVFCLGTLRHDQIRRGAAKGVGNPVFYVGAKTGRDGLAGAAFASRDLTEESKADRPAVQVGDPFVGKLLFEACLELYARPDLVVGVQDMGAAGLTCSTCETASRGGSGIEIELRKVPQRETGMTPFETLLSESQERMLIIVRKGRERELKEIFARWGLDAAEIGTVTDTGRVVVMEGGKVVADLPARMLADDAPVYERAAMTPAKLAEKQKYDLGKILPAQPRVKEDLLKLARSPATGSRRWVWNQYDHMVGLRTVVRPGSDAAVLRVEKPGGGWVRVAMTLDGNGRWCAQDPREGSKALVAEACRNLACAGAVPLGLTDNLNYGNPHDPELFWQLREGVEGMAEACRAFDLPVTGGNVSLYNQSPSGPIHPTPVVGVVGKVDEGVKLAPAVFSTGGGEVVLLGTTASGGLGASLYLQEVHGVIAGKLAAVDLVSEKKLHAVTRMVLAQPGVRAVHDVGEGGILWALAEMTFGEGSAGGEFRVPCGKERPEEALFGEGAGRILVELDETSMPTVENLAKEGGVELTHLGRTGGKDLQVTVHGAEMIWPVAELRDGFEKSLPKALGP
ncbi:MAG: phosphoribosylformylglycinamidine synthase subunit PurL [Verrucomicrobia bacterium]|nr:phosphoribosylformylglycinamidine synthase subunit PurL [Verrucomicrobiota bacterium]